MHLPSLRRLAVGGSSYAVVRRSPPTPGRWSLALYGAVGPPVEWVRLCDLEFRID